MNRCAYEPILEPISETFEGGPALPVRFTYLSATPKPVLIPDMIAAPFPGNNVETKGVATEANLCATGSAFLTTPPILRPTFASFLNMPIAMLECL